MKASEFLKKHEERKAREEAGEQGETRDHSLQENARDRARHPDHLNAGTPYDWEDLEAYQRELKRLDEEGPGTREED
ncbi:peptidase S14 [Gilvimarinus sp. F26214L]|uniref:peptidase S14 n=1 Tax=Gilvimarinus sp. DZF01 TaxID=3461371 RepID=UPI0040462131